MTARRVVLSVHLEIDDATPAEDLSTSALVEGLASNATTLLSQMPLPVVAVRVLGGRPRRDYVAATRSSLSAPPAPPTWHDASQRLRRLCAELPAEAAWDAEEYERGEQASSDYVDGFNDGRWFAVELAEEATVVLGELDDLRRRVLAQEGPAEAFRQRAALDALLLFLETSGERGDKVQAAVEYASRLVAELERTRGQHAPRTSPEAGDDARSSPPGTPPKTSEARDLAAAQAVVRAAYETVEMAHEGLAPVGSLERALTAHDTTVGPLPPE